MSCWIPVVAAAIFREDQQVLLQQCLPGKRHAGLWEFPGGKVEPDETPEEALAREIDEELGLHLRPEFLFPLGFASEAVRDGPAILLLLYGCRAWSGEPDPREGQLFGWFPASTARTLAMPELDSVLLNSAFGQG